MLYRRLFANVKPTLVKERQNNVELSYRRINVISTKFKFQHCPTCCCDMHVLPDFSSI